MVALRLLQGRDAPPIHQRRSCVRDVWIVNPDNMSARDFVNEFIWTWPRHEGKVTVAARIFDMEPASFVQRLLRARKSGIEVSFYNDTNPAGAK